jgi:hypothetical protein
MKAQGINESDPEFAQLSLILKAVHQQHAYKNQQMQMQIQHQQQQQQHSLQMRQQQHQRQASQNGVSQVNGIISFL